MGLGPNLSGEELPLLGAAPGEEASLSSRWALVRVRVRVKGEGEGEG